MIEFEVFRQNLRIYGYALAAMNEYRDEDGYLCIYVIAKKEDENKCVTREGRDYQKVFEKVIEEIDEIEEKGRKCECQSYECNEDVLESLEEIADVMNEVDLPFAELEQLNDVIGTAADDVQSMDEEDISESLNEAHKLLRKAKEEDKI